MKVKKITVKNLFGMFCHEIPLNMAEHITIIHGPNGIGKTILLTMLNALFSSSYEKLRRIPFNEFSIDFEDGSVLSLEREIKSDLVERNMGDDDYGLVFKFNKHGSNLESYTVAPARREDINFPLEMLEDVIPGLEQIGPNNWIHVPTEEKLSLEAVLYRFGDSLPFKSRKIRRENEPDWLKEIRNLIHIRLIDTKRLLSFSHPRSRRKYGKSYLMTTPSVISYSEELADAIQEKLAEYATLSQSLDRTFPTKLVKGNGYSELTIDALRDDLSKLEKKRSRLMEAGLLDKEKEIDFTGLIQQIGESNRNVLSVYVGDVKEKLKVFDELTDKIDLLVDIINRRFLYKKMSINKKEGFIFETSDGKKISPADLSSGEQHELVLNYELLFKVKPNSLILIDEPELSLHVIWQQQFLKDLQEIIKLAGFDVLLATHAPDIIHNRWDLTVELGGSTK